MTDRALDSERSAPAPDAPGTLVEIQRRVNALWRVAGPPPEGRSAAHRVLYAVRRALAALLRPQETFNSAVVQYINAAVEQLDEPRRVATELEFVLDDMRRHAEAAAARERRLESAVAAIRAEQEQVRTALGVLQQATTHLHRQLSQGPHTALGTPGDAAAAPVIHASSPGGHTLSYRYVGFEDLFRGSPEAIRARMRDYVALFEGASDVLDLGCGRGEFLALLRDHGITARGVDLNESMVDLCRRQGLAAEAADALSFLRAAPDGAFGGLFAAQVVEHLEPGYLTQLLDAAFQKLRPGALIVLETINPACWFAFFESYIRDITHVRPLHPDTLTFLLVAAGFQQVSIRYQAPFPEHEKLQGVPASGALADAAEAINANVEKLNRLLFTHLDYAAIGRRP